MKATYTLNSFQDKKVVPICAFCCQGALTPYEEERKEWLIITSLDQRADPRTPFCLYLLSTSQARDTLSLILVERPIDPIQGPKTRSSRESPQTIPQRWSRPGNSNIRKISSTCSTSNYTKFLWIQLPYRPFACVKRCHNSCSICLSKIGAAPIFLQQEKCDSP